jgi:hypothetical protein
VTTDRALEVLENWELKGLPRICCAMFINENGALTFSTLPHHLLTATTTIEGQSADVKVKLKRAKQGECGKS